MLKEYKARISATYKNADTEEWLDIRFNRPIGYLWALFFKKLRVTPNVVTILSIIIGVAAGWMFHYQDIFHNIAGVLLLMWANFYDSADGQLARMTGKKTRWGRMLDGFAGDLWFFAIYLAIVFRLWNEFIPFTHVHWNFLILLLAVSPACSATQSSASSPTITATFTCFSRLARTTASLTIRASSAFCSTQRQRKETFGGVPFCTSTATTHIRRNLSHPTCKTCLT